MKLERPTVAVVGVGEVGALHCHSAAGSTMVDFIAGVDPRPGRHAFVEQLGAAAFPTMDAMLSACRPDLVCIATPTSLHEQQVLAAAAAGSHILCEKPLTLSLASATRMIEACRTAGVRLFYGASYRHLLPLIRARELIAEGAIGDVLLVCERLVGGKGAAARIPPLGPIHYPIGGPGGGGMGMVDHGIHLLDTIPWLTGRRIVSAFGRANVAGGPIHPEHAVLALEGGAFGHLVYDDGSFPAELPTEGAFSRGREFGISELSAAGTWLESPGTILVYGTKGTLRIQHYAGYLHLIDHRGTQEIPLEGHHAPDHFRLQLEMAAQDLRDGTAEAATGEDGLAALKTLLAIYRSQEEGRQVELT